MKIIKPKYKHNKNLFGNEVGEKLINKRIQYFDNLIFKTKYMKNKNNKIIIENKNDIKKQVNLGIQLLRSILCFWVVSFHNMKRKKVLVRKILKKHFHVPTFFIISFYYLSKNYNKRNINKFNQRFERLLIPYLIWSIIVWIFNNLLFLFTKTNRFNRILSLYDFILQLIFGRNYIRCFLVSIYDNLFNYFFLYFSFFKDEYIINFLYIKYYILFFPIFRL